MVKMIVGRYEYAQRLQGLHADLEARLSPPPVPARLYHYTSAETLLNILGNHTLRATSLQYMNDLSELEWGAQLVERVLRETRREAGGERIRAWLDAVARGSNPFDADLEVYAFCFCEAGDRLSQWREYAGKGTGYAMGFDGPALARRIQRMDAGLMLTKVLYDRARQEDEVREVVRTTFRALLDVVDDAEDPEDVLREYGTFLAMRLARCLFTFKSPAFQEEGEWRLVWVRPGQTTNVRFRAGNGTIVPFVEIPFTDRNDPYPGRLPLAEIVQGPQVAPTIGARALRRVLDVGPYRDVQEARSEVPLRF